MNSANSHSRNRISPRQSLRTNKLVAFVPVTDELLEDSVALGEHISAKAPDKINFAAELAIIAGNGIGRPKGIINSAGTVVVAEEAAQTAATIVHANVRKLWRALTPTARKKCYFWLCHPDADEQLQSLALPGNAGDNGSEPLYLEPRLRSRLTVHCSDVRFNQAKPAQRLHQATSLPPICPGT